MTDATATPYVIGYIFSYSRSILGLDQVQAFEFLSTSEEELENCESLFLNSLATPQIYMSVAIPKAAHFSGHEICQNRLKCIAPLKDLLARTQSLLIGLPPISFTIRYLSS